MSDDSEDFIIEKVDKREKGRPSEEYFYQEVRIGKGGLPLKTRIKIWAFVLGGIVIGTLLFLFFITAFIYFFIPLMILFALWNLFSRRH